MKKHEKKRALYNLLLFSMLFVSQVYSFAPTYQSLPTLERNRKKYKPITSFLDTLPRELLFQLTQYATLDRNPHNHLEYIFNHFTPNENEARRIVGHYTHHMRKDPYFFFSALARSPARRQLMQACMYYFTLGKKITTDIENSDISSLKIDLKPLDMPFDEHTINSDAHLLHSIDLNKMFDDIYQEREQYRNSIDKCTTCMMDWPSCIIFDWSISIICLTLGLASGIFIPSRISHFDFGKCTTFARFDCWDNPPLYQCTGSYPDNHDNCCFAYALDHCAKQEILFNQDHAWEQLIPWIPMGVVLLGIITVNACLLYLRFCHKPKSINPEIRSLIQQYHQKIQRQNSDITEIV